MTNYEKVKSLEGVDNETAYKVMHTEDPHMRKIIQISCSETQSDYEDENAFCHNSSLYALCDDGTLWVFDNQGGWELMPNVPQDDAPIVVKGESKD